MSLSSTDTKYSNFLITINSNQSSDDYKAKLKDAFDIFYDSINEFLLYLEDGASWSDIKNVSGEGVLEVGSKLGKIHLHALVCINHNTKIRLDFEQIRLFFGDLLGCGPSGFHLDVKMVRDHSNIWRYLRKTVGR